jgi:hypothetical protein
MFIYLFLVKIGVSRLNAGFQVKPRHGPGHEDMLSW